jgi:hypothetical protein
MMLKSACAYFCLAVVSALKHEFLEQYATEKRIDTSSDAIVVVPMSAVLTKAHEWWATRVTTLVKMHARVRRDSSLPKTQPMSFHLMDNMQGSASDDFLRVMSTLVMVAIFVGLIGMLVCALPDDDEAADRTMQGDKIKKVDTQFRPMSEQDLKFSQPNLPEVVEATPPKSADDLRFAVAGHEGTWAEIYRESSENQREALELLFRCGIIPVHEFKYHRVKKEHISECVWIATNMLRKKPLEDWVTSWAEAQQSFEESVTQSFAKRTETVQSERSLSQEHTPDDAGEQFSPDVAKHRPYSSPILGALDDSGQNKLLVRCREVIASKESGVSRSLNYAFVKSSPPPPVPEGEEEEEEGDARRRMMMPQMETPAYFSPEDPYVAGQRPLSADSQFVPIQRSPYSLGASGVVSAGTVEDSGGDILTQCREVIAQTSNESILSKSVPAMGEEDDADMSRFQDRVAMDDIGANVSQDDPYVPHRYSPAQRASSPPPQESVFGAVDDSGENKLLQRCREIIASTSKDIVAPRNTGNPPAAPAPSVKSVSKPPTVVDDAGEEEVEEQPRRVMMPKPLEHVPPRPLFKVSHDTPVSELYGSSPDKGAGFVSGWSSRPSPDRGAGFVSLPSAKRLGHGSPGSSAADPFPREDVPLGGKGMPEDVTRVGKGFPG